MAIVLIAALFALIYRTPVGLRMRAVANDSALAAYGGVRVTRISALAWGSRPRPRARPGSATPSGR